MQTQLNKRESNTGITNKKSEQKNIKKIGKTNSTLSKLGMGRKGRNQGSILTM